MAQYPTRYAKDREGPVCVLVEVRGRASPYHLLVWSYSKNNLVKLPYRYRDGRELTRIETPSARRWAAVTVPRWLANAEGLYGRPDLPPVSPGYCQQQTAETRTADQIRDDGERELAEYIVKSENRYRRLPGQDLHNPKGDRRNAAIFA